MSYPNMAMNLWQNACRDNCNSARSSVVVVEVLASSRGGTATVDPFFSGCGSTLLSSSESFTVASTSRNQLNTYLVTWSSISSNCLCNRMAQSRLIDAFIKVVRENAYKERENAVLLIIEGHPLLQLVEGDVFVPDDLRLGRFADT